MIIIRNRGWPLRRGLEIHKYPRGAGFLSTVGQLIGQAVGSQTAKTLAANTAKMLLETTAKKVGDEAGKKIVDTVANTISKIRQRGVQPESKAKLEKIIASSITKVTPNPSLNNLIAGSGKRKDIIAIEKLARKLNGSGLKIV